MTDRTLLARAAELAADHLDSIAKRHAGALAGAAELRDALGGGLPDDGVPADRVIEELARDAAPGIVASPGPRYFGFVVGGAVPAALAADWLRPPGPAHPVLPHAGPGCAGAPGGGAQKRFRRGAAPGRRGRRGGRGRVAARAARPARGRGRRAHDG